MRLARGTASGPTPLTSMALAMFPARVDYEYLKRVHRPKSCEHNTTLWMYLYHQSMYDYMCITISAPRTRPN